MELTEIGAIALKAGDLLLKNGAEIYRVEDTVSRICRAYGAECECAALTTAIFLCVWQSGGFEGAQSFVHRIHNRGYNLGIVTRVNQFSRECVEIKPTYSEAAERLREIERPQKQNLPLKSALLAICGASFTVILDGGPAEIAVSLAGAWIVFLLGTLCERKNISPFIKYFFCGAAAGLSVTVASVWLRGFGALITAAGMLVTLLPGISLTNSIRDILYGDVLSGAARILEIIFLMAAMCAGLALCFPAGLDTIV